MTNGEALQALDVVRAIPLTSGHSHDYVAALILLKADLQRIARELEPQRVDLVMDSRTAAEVPEDFDERMARYIADSDSEPDLKETIAKVEAHFAPAWTALMAEPCTLRFSLLTPGEFAGVCAVVMAPDAPITYHVGRGVVDAEGLLELAAATIVAPEP